MADERDNNVKDDDSLKDFAENRKGQMQSFEMDSAKLDLELTKLTEDLDRLTESLLQLQARHREVQWKRDVLRIEVKCLEEAVERREKTDDFLREKVLQIQSEILNERTVNVEQKLCLFEAQMDEVVGLLEEAILDYSESNLEVEKKQMLAEFDEITTSVIKQMQEIDALSQKCDHLKTVAFEKEAGKNAEDEIFEAELANALELFEDENRRWKSAGDNYVEVGSEASD